MLALQHPVVGRGSRMRSPGGGRIDSAGTPMSKVLLVDADLDCCAFIEFKLASLGHDVVTEHDGAAGLAAARNEAPDIVLVDWSLPQISGVEACTELRDDPILARVPVILLVSRTDEVDVQRGFAAGADDYILKPIHPRELASRVGALLERADR